MNVIFYTNKSDRNRPVKNLAQVATKNLELKGDCSLATPTFIITGDAADYAFCNYFYVPDFHRYYFADPVTSNPGGLLTISGSCDVLSSAWPYVKDLECVLDRQENNYNVYLNDGTFQSYCNDKIVTKEFSGGFSAPSYVLVVAG